MNKFIATGNLVREMDLNQSSNGTAYLRNAIAVKDDYKKDVTHFFNFTAFGKTAEAMATYLNKGSKILIEASLNQNTYEKDGQKRTTIDLNVSRFEFLDSKGSQGNGDAGNQPSRPNTNRTQNYSNTQANDPFLNSGKSIDIDDSSLPF